MAIHSSILAWKIQRAEEPGRLQSMGSQESDTTERLHFTCLRPQAFNKKLSVKRASLVAQLVKNLPAMLETWVLSLGWEDPLEKGTATHSSILAWRISRTV